jgi:hypothetical protein
LCTHAQIAHEETSKVAVANQFSHATVRWIRPVLVHIGHFAGRVSIGCSDGAICVFERARHWLFAENMFARSERIENYPGVRMRRRTDADNLDVIPAEQLVIIAVRVGKTVGSLRSRSASGIDISYRD